MTQFTQIDRTRRIEYTFDNYITDRPNKEEYIFSIISNCYCRMTVFNYIHFP